MPKRIFPLDAVLLDRDSDVPLHRQLYLALKRLIQERTLAADMALPSTRSLANDLEIARNTVSTAYDQLVTEGFLANRAGARPMIIDLPAVSPPPSCREQVETRFPLSRRGELMTRQPFHYGSPGHMAFHPGMPDASNFPFSLWSRLLARRASFARDTLFGTYNVTGHPDLRHAIAAFLKTARGVHFTPEQIVVTTGAQAALDLLARILLDPGDAVWMEEPGYYGAQSAFIAAGARLLPMPVQGSDWVLDPPADKRLRLIYVTPSCHHPLGGTMRMEQRLRLMEIAATRKAWIIEDDFDGEYRFQGQPIPAMQGLDQAQRVIYVGTFAKILFPALRLGFLVLPPSLHRGIQHAVSITGQFAPLLLQAALADFIEMGHMARHLRRMRRIYAVRRQNFRDLCEAHLGEWMQLLSGEAGIQITGLLHGALNDNKVAAAALERNVSVSPLSMHYRHGLAKHGLVMGYAASDEAITQRAILRLRHAFEA
jgi:GntR family transcriptional regulator / MocR family aminotransferase